MRTPTVLGMGLLVTATLLPACGGNDSLAPFQPQVTNAADNFQLQATGLTGITTTVQYTWQNSGTSANIDQSGAVTGGSATITIRDNGGTQVYTSNLATTGSFTSSVGTTGTWTIRVVLNNMSGTLNFRVQKP